MNEQNPQMLKEYFKGLGYKLESYQNKNLIFKHEISLKIVHLMLGLNAHKMLPDQNWDRQIHYILVLSDEDIDIITIDVLESYSDKLPPNVGIAIYGEDSTEHMIKDIWFFLNK